ncbi:hypothetical protein ACQVP2_14855 [Methylobacterium aquaticum]|jgi:hypothetical protein|uniref:hypothetical protein n=1 Tax=Methylobacterium aquaticum TaxID=270351 RepID=UPI0019324650|nr:hypothetical protein [Methylobacterium aquaticum]QRE78209.1 hypothetical protein F1D61_32850 [Methylobacterium aquaticum]
MFLVWTIGIGLMALSGWLFYRFMVNHAIPYENFHFENSNEHGILAPKDWEEYKKFKKIEIKSQVQGTIILVPIVILFIVGIVIFLFTTATFMSRV